MRKIRKTFTKFDADKEKEVFSLFNYKVLSVKEKNTMVKVVAEYDENEAKHSSKLALYKKVSKWSFLPLYPVFIFTGAAIICISVLLALFLAFKGDPNLVIYLVALGTPSCLFLLATVFYTYLKFRNDLHNINNTYTLFEIKALVEQLESENKNE